MRAAVLQEDGRFAVQEMPDPEPRSFEALLRVAYCGVGAADVQAAVSQASGGNGANSGTVLGREISGEIVALGEDAIGFKVGDRVTTLSSAPCDACPECRESRFESCSGGWRTLGRSDHPGGFAELVTTHIASMLKLPDELSDRAGALTDPARVAVHAVAQSRLTLGASAAIIGAGGAGLLTLQAARLNSPAAIYVVDASAERRSRALELGATEAFDANAEGTSAALLDRTGIGPDVVFDCAGAAGTMQQAAQWARPGGQVMLVTPNLGEDELEPSRLIVREIEFKAGGGGMQPLRDALGYLAAGRIDAEAVVTRSAGLDDLNDVLDSLRKDGSDEGKVLVAPNG